MQVTISTTDRRNNKLIFKVNLVEMESKILVDFRLSKVSGESGGVRVGARWVRDGCEVMQGLARPCKVGAGPCKVGAGPCKVGAGPCKVMRDRAR